MAPRKASGVGARNPEPRTGTDGRVKKNGKRGTKGYRKFKSGMLNVVPETDEKILVETNGRSPLLRLPPEIRNRIWSYVFGGMMARIYHPRYDRSKLRLDANCPTNFMALLTTCRQIYSETAILPYKLITFVSDNTGDLWTALRKLRRYQYTQITFIRFKVWVPNMYWVANWDLATTTAKFSFLEKLPRVKKIDIHFFYCQPKEVAPLQELKSRLLDSLEAFLPEIEIAVTIEEHRRMIHERRRSNDAAHP